jgi:hypothetical protein
MVRIGFTSRMLTSGGSFTPGQLCLICKQKNDKLRLEGSAINAYPIGYIKAANQIQLKGLADQITLSDQDMTEGTRWIDFVFYIPSGFQPVAVAFKANTFAEIPPMITTEEAPKPVPFTQSSNCATGYARVAPAGTAKIYGLELAAKPRLLEGTKLKVADQLQWTNMQTQRSIAPARFDQDAITCVQAELVEPNQADQPMGDNKLRQMLRPTSGYSVLSLKCNNPAARSAVRGEQLPMLIDSSGVTHRPCGLIAAGKIAGKTIFEADFCPANITFNNDGSVAKPFPENIWLAEQAESVSEFYVLYMVRPGTIIVSVQPVGVQTAAAFDGTECFLVN